MSSIAFPWEEPYLSFQIFGNLYFLGNHGASAHLVDTGDGLIMFDCGYQQGLEQTLEHIRCLGFDPMDIKLLMITHGHIDHFGAAKAIRDMTGCKIALGRADRDYATGARDLSYAKELGMTFLEYFDPDLLLDDGDRIELGNTEVTAIATPGHTEGAMTYFFRVSDGAESLRAALHAGVGFNSMREEFLREYGLPLTLREDFCRSLSRLSEEPVDIFLGNHMSQNETGRKRRAILSGDLRAFIDADEWKRFNLQTVEEMKKFMLQDA